MLNRITQALKAKKYHLPQVGSYTGAQLAAMLTERNAPADTIEAFKKYVSFVKMNPPRKIVIAPPAF